MSDPRTGTGLRIETLTPADDAALADWRHVHNTVVPVASALLSLEDVRERAGRNVLEVAYAADGTLVGCTTVRPPRDGAAATVIARVLPGHRGRGLGTVLYERGLAAARTLGADAVETVVLTSNAAGLRFAERAGFTVEVDRYRLDGDTVDWVELRLA
ncbi:GNAT family N-acetyltransferase [Streptomyces sp. SID5785]|uniref:GNAT family N-acetyltransferase n=1 Tax=Streptomyces sp. SID5785 TaxID=2690309 RepID=UPI001361C345|nr:GNAT family N-acetyltransferase [Streptomyces sp. SID5785]MZD07187.1 GNAT family N-acetyltransferase [Streptomyces sp. SID5785]